MTEKQLLKWAKRFGIGATSMIVVTAVIISVIKANSPAPPMTWVQESVVTDKNTPSRIRYNRTMISFGNSDNRPAKVDKPANIDMTTGDTAVSINSHYSQLSQECNVALYSICKRNFSVSVGNIELTPLVPMIIANVETGIRADPSITFSSLYPSRVLKPTVASDIYSVCCLDVIASRQNFEELASEYWTRDRGPCQMSPSYGVRNDIYTTAMGRSEADVLSNISDEKDYSTYTTREGIITYKQWIFAASTEKGDRFNPKDICLRLSSEYNYALNTAAQTYDIDTELLAIAMCAMHHGSSSLWLPDYEENVIGLWNSGRRAYELACSLTTQAAYDIIKDEVVKDLSSARSSGSNPAVCIDTNRANDIYRKLQNKNIVKEQSYYMSGGQYSKDYAVYPIKALYCYVQLSLLYNGG